MIPSGKLGAEPTIMMVLGFLHVMSTYTHLMGLLGVWLKVEHN